MRRLVVAGVVLAAACVRGGPPDGRVFVHVADGMVTAELADTPAKRQTGLMNRVSLESDGGMLFVFPSPVSGGFWMKDTKIPLGIAFIRDRRVVALMEMVPCVADPCPLYRPDQPYDMALEVNKGWFKRAKARPGDRVRIVGELGKAR